MYIFGGDRNYWLVLLSVMMLINPMLSTDKSKVVLYIERFFLVIVPVVVAISIWQLVHLQKVRLFDLVTLTVAYGVWLFVLLCELMTMGLACWLTDKRGDKWPKELDYVYLLFASTGLLCTIDRLDIVAEKIGISDGLGPLLIVTALAIRALKTKSEINEWNKIKSP